MIRRLATLAAAALVVAAPAAAAPAAVADPAAATVATATGSDHHRRCRSAAAPTPASMAAPRPVVSMLRGRSTGRPVASAISWQSQLLATMPPSTLSAEGWTSSAWKASIRSAVCCPMASNVARTMWARVVPPVRPVRVPRACCCQWGAPSPAKAGTKLTPPLSGTDVASASDSAAVSRMPRPSRSHLTALPPTKIEPSSA